jgi:hypothetical protein
MTFEEFKKEVERGDGDMYNITEIAYKAAEVDWNNKDLNESPPEIVIKALSYLTLIEEAENIFRDFLKSKGIEIK